MAASNSLTFEQRIAAAVTAKKTVPAKASGAGVAVTVGGVEYPGINAVPLQDLALIDADEYAALPNTVKAHRSRRLLKASVPGAKDGFSAAQVKALRAAGILPAA